MKALLLMTLAGCSSCAGVQSPADLNCATTARSKLAAQLAPALIAVLDHPPRTAQSALASLAPVGDAAILCGVDAIVSGMEAGQSMGVPPQSQVQVLASGRAYLIAKGRRTNSP